MDLPRFLCAFPWRNHCGDRGILNDHCATGFCVLQKELVQIPSANRDLRKCRWRKREADATVIAPDKIDPGKTGVNQLQDAFCNAHPLKDRPCSGVQAIATNLIPREMCPLQDCRSQTCTCAKCGAGRPSRSATDNSDVERMGGGVCHQVKARAELCYRMHLSVLRTQRVLLPSASRTSV